jgi:hypothetical protein
MGRKLTQEEFLKKANFVHDNYYDYSKTEYKGGHQRINIICPKHGPFDQLAINHLNGQGCPECGRFQRKSSNTKTLENFIIQAKKIYGDLYNYDATKYINTKTKIIVSCNIHREFEISPSNFLSGHGCPRCGIEQRAKTQSSTTTEFIKNAKKIHGDNTYKYNLVEYINQKTKIKIICPTHGVFEQTPSNHLSKKSICPDCATQNAITKPEIFLDRANEKFGEKFIYNMNEYIDMCTKISITCPTHGTFKNTPTAHLTSITGCMECGLAQTHQTNTKSTQEFINEAVECHGDRYNYTLVNYISGFIPVEIICSIHKSFFQTPNTHIRGADCPKCYNSSSKIENEWLDSMGILKHNRQHKIQLNNFKIITVDGYDPDTNTVYEFNGDFWHGNPKTYPTGFNKVTKCDFEILYFRTLDKAENIINSGYNLISIWESDWKEQKKEGRF